MNWSRARTSCSVAVWLENVNAFTDVSVVAVAVTNSGRPLARVGGLTKDQIKGEDGLR